MVDQPDMPPEPRVVVPVGRTPRPMSNGIARASVFAALTAAFTVFLLAAGLLYYRYLTVQQPTCIVWVTGNSSFEGATVTVSSLSMEAPLRDTLRPTSRFCTRFFMNPGNYHVKIVDKAGQTLYEENVSLYPSFPFDVDLPRLKPDTRPL
jgi:hypothetical protein